MAGVLLKVVFAFDARHALDRKLDDFDVVHQAVAATYVRLEVLAVVLADVLRDYCSAGR